jgi:hypothetical protein
MCPGARSGAAALVVSLLCAVYVTTLLLLATAKYVKHGGFTCVAAHGVFNWELGGLGVKEGGADWLREREVSEEEGM